MSLHDDKINALDHAWQDSVFPQGYAQQYRTLSSLLQAQAYCHAIDSQMRVSLLFVYSTKYVKILHALLGIEWLNVSYALQRLSCIINTAKQILLSRVSTPSDQNVIIRAGRSMHYSLTVPSDCLCVLLELLFLCMRAIIRCGLLLVMLILCLGFDLSALLSYTYDYLFMNKKVPALARLILLFTLVPLYYIKIYVTMLIALLNALPPLRVLAGSILTVFYSAVFLTSITLAFLWDQLTLFCRSLPVLLTALLGTLVKCLCLPHRPIQTLWQHTKRSKPKRVCLTIIPLLCLSSAGICLLSFYLLGLWPMVVHYVSVPVYLLALLQSPPLPPSCALAISVFCIYTGIQCLLYTLSVALTHAQTTKQRTHDLYGTKWRLRMRMLKAIFNWLFLSKMTFFMSIDQSEIDRKHLFENNLYYSLQHGIGERFFSYLLLLPCPRQHSFWHGMHHTTFDDQDEESADEMSTFSH